MKKYIWSLFFKLVVIIATVLFAYNVFKAYGKALRSINKKDKK